MRPREFILAEHTISRRGQYCYSTYLRDNALTGAMGPSELHQVTNTVTQRLNIQLKKITPVMVLFALCMVCICCARVRNSDLDKRALSSSFNADPCGLLSKCVTVEKASSRSNFVLKSHQEKTTKHTNALRITPRRVTRRQVYSS